MTNYAKEAAPLHSTLKQLTKNFMGDLERAHFTTRDIGKCYGALSDTVNTYNKKVPFGQCPELGDQFSQMRDSFTVWSEILLRERNTL